MESLLERMDSTPLDDLLDYWLQPLEPSENLDGDWKGGQVVSSAEIPPFPGAEDPHHWFYFLTDHSYLSVPDLSRVQNT